MATVGVLGAGQLGRMLALAGLAMGVRLRFLDPACAGAEGCPCDGLGEIVPGGFDDQAALDRLADVCDVVTLEFENVPVEAVEYLSDQVKVRPAATALRTAQDRLLEKRAFAACGVATNTTVAWDAATQGRDDLLAALNAVGLPAIVKTRRMGYDGKGQARIATVSDVDRAIGSLPSVPLLVESCVAFRRELSIVGVRSAAGKSRFYPLVENTHEHGILRRTVAPAPGVAPALQTSAENAAKSIMDHLGYVGVMALELFEDQDGTLLANEIAPRVHNTGHWTIEGAATSQFENHLRAILGWSLGETEPVGHSVMVNLIGERPDAADLLAIPGASYHWYGKAVRPGRKVGHVTVNARSAAEAEHRAQQVEALLATGAD
ncbi:MAG: 5-(carboxyamino)imidazole ribonucleotide synthase [Phycisphaerales bacterium]